MGQIGATGETELPGLPGSGLLDLTHMDEETMPLPLVHAVTVEINCLYVVHSWDVDRRSCLAVSFCP